MVFELATAAPAPHSGYGGWQHWGKQWSDWWKSHGDDHQKPPPYHPGRPGHEAKKLNVQVGPRPYYLVDNMDEGPLKDKLESCKEDEKSTSSFSISHRGAPLMFPEHSKQSYEAAIRMGAGECIERCRYCWISELTSTRHCRMRCIFHLRSRARLSSFELRPSLHDRSSGTP